MVRESEDREQPSVLFHLQLVGKIAASVAAIAVVGLTLVVALLISDKGGSYREIVAAYGFARENLGPALLLFGLAMVLVSGIATWLVTLYASFSFAGPIYRFCRNLELVIEKGPVLPVPLRGTDRMQRQCDRFSEAVGKLREHYGDLRVLSGQLEQATKNAAADGDLTRQLIERLKETNRRVRL